MQGRDAFCDFRILNSLLKILKVPEVMKEVYLREKIIRSNIREASGTEPECADVGCAIKVPRYVAKDFWRKRVHCEAGDSKLWSCGVANKAIEKEEREEDEDIVILRSSASACR
jgi:hypothetical protein